MKETILAIIDAATIFTLAYLLFTVSQLKAEIKELRADRDEKP